jgi:transposase
MKIIFDWLDSIKGRKEINVKTLPSQGIFYEKDFKIWIKKVKIEDILEYEKLYINDIAIVLTLIKKIVQNYTSMPSKYVFDDIKSTDIIFLFLEIVRMSTGRGIKIEYYNDISGVNELLEFTPNNFSYFNIPENLKKTFNKDTKEFVIGGYRFSIPSIGIETSLTQYLVEKSYSKDVEKYNNYAYDFMYFLGNKKRLTFAEIDNLIEIFNTDMSDEEKEKVQNIVEQFRGFAKYMIKDNSRVIEINNRIDLEKVWK